mmetsp:Transcript_28292/g.32101  ORF Transcript_28292/g.32101 Transcript_28292/m.32101 type:complete len:96 (+) Transcript_28292:229-516(+)
MNRIPVLIIIIASTDLVRILIYTSSHSRVHDEQYIHNMKAIKLEHRSSSFMIKRQQKLFPLVFRVYFCAWRRKKEGDKKGERSRRKRGTSMPRRK